MKKTYTEGMLEVYIKNSKACLETVTKSETMEVDFVGSLLSKQTEDFINCIRWKIY